MKAIIMAQENLHREIPEYISLGEDKFSGQLLTSPQVDQVPIPIPINIPLVCEFIAHTS